MIEATCHCGAVRMEISVAPTSVTDCNCSICRRLGTLWAYYHPDQVKFVSRGTTIAYSWGEKSLEFHRCKICGCITHWQPVEMAGAKRMGVNTRLMDPKEIVDVHVRKFDRASM